MSKSTEDLSKAALLQWLNDLLKLSVTHVQQLGTGAVYCQLLDAAFPGKVPMQKINWKAKLENDNLNNLKLLTSTMENLKVAKYIDIQKLAKLRFQDNFELLVWFKKFVISSNSELSNYKPFERRDSIPDFPQFKDKIVFKGTKHQVHIKDRSKIEQKVPPKQSFKPARMTTQKSFAPKQAKEEILILQKIAQIQKSKQLSPEEKLVEIRRLIENQSKETELKTNSSQPQPKPQKVYGSEQLPQKVYPSVPESLPPCVMDSFFVPKLLQKQISPIDKITSEVEHENEGNRKFLNNGYSNANYQYQVQRDSDFTLSGDSHHFNREKEIFIVQTNPITHVQMKSHIVEKTYEDPSNAFNHLFITDIKKEYEVSENQPSQANLSLKHPASENQKIKTQTPPIKSDTKAFAPQNDSKGFAFIRPQPDKSSTTTTTPKSQMHPSTIISNK